jgi:tetratricopeptide (TPR) repeat protein
VVQLLRGVQEAGFLDGAGVEEWALAEAARLLPGVGDPSQPVEGLGEARLFDAVATLLLALGGSRPLVVAIDDGQWLDPASAALLSYLTHRISDAGVLLILAIRTDSDPSTEAIAILESFAEGAAVVALRPFEAEDLVGLVADEGVAADVVGRTGGIPFLVAEYLAGSNASELSSGVRRYIDGRLRSLDGLAAQVVAAAAVLNGTCDVPLLRAASGRSEEEVVDAVDRLMRLRILREVPGAPRLGFWLEAMEQVVYAGLTPVRRRLLHGRAADALADRPGADRDARSAAIVANHLREGGRDAESAHWFATAGHLAAAVYAHAEAEAAYRAALALGHPAPGPIHYALGEVLLLAAHYRDALEAYQAAAVDPGEGVAAWAEHRIGEVHRRLGRFDLAEHHFALAEEHHPQPTTLYADWAMLEHRRRHTDRSAGLARRAVDLAEAAGDVALEARARDILGIVTEDVEQLERALVLAGDDPVLRLAALNSLAYALAGEGDLGRAVDLVAEGVDLAERVGDRHRRAALLNHLADLHHRAGREEESKAALTAAVRLFADVQPDAWEPEVWLLSRW